MQISLLLMEEIAKLFAIMLMGYAVVKAGLMKSSESKSISVVMVYLVIPCVIIDAFQVDYTPDVKKGLLLALNRSPSSRQLKKYKFFLPAEIYLLAVFMRLASKFRVFPLVLKFRDSFVSVYCYSNLYNLRSFLREYLYQ